MKYLLTSLFIVCLSFSALAQEKTVDKAQQEKKMSKEEKATAKAKREADLQESFKAAEFTADEQQKTKDLMAESSQLVKTFTSDTSLSEDDAKAKSKEIYKERDAKIKTLVGDFKYKIYKQTQKAQKEVSKM